MPRRPGAAAPLRRAALAVNGAYLVLLVLGPDGHRLWRELGLQVAALGMSAAYVWVLVARERRHRSWRIPVALWITFFTLANVLSNAHTGTVQPQWSVLPSVLLYLPAYPCALIAVAVLFRGRLRGAAPGPIVDAAVAALAIAAVFAGFIGPATVASLGPDGLPVWLALLFPACDLFVLAFVVAGIAVSGPERFSGWFVLGICLFGSADWWYFVQVSLGQWRTGTLLDGVWVTACAVIGLMAAPAPDRDGRAAGRTWSTTALAVPFVAAIVAVAILVVGTRVPVPLPGVLLAAAALVGVLTRLAVAYAGERRHAAVAELARTDELTGLVNRRGLYAELDVALESREPFAVLLGDLDRFKEVNDSFGHAAGDLLLQHVAARLRAGTPPEALLARLGGDEFAVLVRPVAVGDDAFGRGVASALDRVLAEPFLVEGTAVPVRVSVGVAVVRPCPEGRPARVARGELLHRADLAMYRAKQAGGGVRTVAVEACTDDVADDGSAGREAGRATGRSARAADAAAGPRLRPVEGSRPTRAG